MCLLADRHYYSAHFMMFSMLVLGTIALALPTPPSERFGIERKVGYTV